MESNFSKEEKRKYMFRKHLKNHLFEYILDFIEPIILTVVLLYLCKAEEFTYGIILSIAFSCGRVGYDLYHYRKEYINMDIK